MYTYECESKIELKEGKVLKGVYVLTTDIETPTVIDKLDEKTIPFPAKFIVDDNEVMYGKEDISKLTIESVTMMEY